jgi:autotransporter-associated beta strand protein
VVLSRKHRSIKQLAVALVATALLGPAASPVLAQERVLGLDVSYWNRTSSGISQTAWNTAYTTPDANGFTRHFVWVRATRGGTTGLDQPQGTPSPHNSISTLSRRYDDPEFLRTMTRSTTAGFFAGPYHFARPDIIASTPDTGGIPNNGTDEANHFLEHASAYMRPGYLIPIFDLEAGQSQRTANELAQFCIDFSERIYQVMRIRPGMYINGNYSSILQGATQARRDQIAQPASAAPSVVSPAYPMLWSARYYAAGTDPNTIPVQTGNPKDNPSTLSWFFGPWDDYGNMQPWSFWQYSSIVAIPGMPDTTMDGNVSHGDIEYVKNYLVPAVWWHDASGDWATLANWNSGQPLSTFNASDLNNPPAPYVPRWGDGQTTPFTSYTFPAPRLPGVAGSGPTATSGVHDTVILERPAANITVTLSSGTYNIRKLYMRETLNITGGSLTVNYNPTYRANNSANVLHGGPISAQFSGPVTLNGGTLSIHTLQVDTNRTFTLASGTLTLNRINLMPHSSTPARILVTGNATLNPLANAAAVIANGSGSGTSGRIDLGGANRSLTIGNGTADVDLSIDVPIINGGLTKLGAGTLRLSGANTYSGGTILSAGRLLVTSGTGTGTFTVNGGTLSGTGTISGLVVLNSGGTLAPGTTANFGTLTLGNSPTFHGTNFMRINRAGAPLADKVVLLLMPQTTGVLTYGGTLTVTNVGAALVGGEVFTLFSAAVSYSGAFSAMNLPPLGAGLNWFTGALVTNGTIRVNRQPATTPLAFTNTAPSVLEIPFATLVANATDPDGNPLTVSSVNLTTTNGITLTTNETTIFYSNQQSVTDQFSYTISDGHGGSAMGVVRIENIGTPPSAEFTSSPSVNGTSVTLSFVATPGWTYYLDRSTNLPIWTTIWTNTAPPSGEFEYTDTFEDLGGQPASAFYRVRWDP